VPRCTGAIGSPVIWPRAAGGGVSTTTITVPLTALRLAAVFVISLETIWLVRRHGSPPPHHRHRWSHYPAVLASRTGRHTDDDMKPTRPCAAWIHSFGCNRTTTPPIADA